MTIHIPCPLLADEDVCGQPLTIEVAPELRATRNLCRLPGTTLREKE
jgi:hypothetical protein